MHPVLFTLGQHVFYTYGALWGLAMVTGICVAVRYARPNGLLPNQALHAGVYAVIGGVIGSKIWFLCVTWSSYHLEETKSRNEFLGFGGVFYGGAIAAIAVIALYARHERVSVLRFYDVGALGLSMGHAIGRLGCFAAGCCFGKVTNSIIGVRFTSELAASLSATPLHIFVHPTQLYEAFFLSLDFVVLLRLNRRLRTPGQLMSFAMVFYGLERLFIEFFRGDPDRTMLFANSASLMQFISVGFVLIGVLFLARNPLALQANARNC